MESLPTEESVQFTDPDPLQKIAQPNPGLTAKLQGNTTASLEEKPVLRRFLGTFTPDHGSFLPNHCRNPIPDLNCLHRPDAPIEFGRRPQFT